MTASRPASHSPALASLHSARHHPISNIATTNETNNVTFLPSTSKAQTAKEGNRRQRKATHRAA
jgi:hypothetical protein